MDLYFDDEHIENEDIINLSMYNTRFSNPGYEEWAISLDYLDLCEYGERKRKIFTIDSIETKDGDIYFYSKDAKEDRKLKEEKIQHNKESLKVLQIAAQTNRKLYIDGEWVGILNDVSTYYDFDNPDFKIRLEYTVENSSLFPTVLNNKFAVSVYPVTIRLEDNRLDIVTANGVAEPFDD